MKKNKFVEILIGIFLLAFCTSSFADDVIVITFPAIDDIIPDKGTTAGGTRVTITGDKFVNGLTVRFGNKFGTVVGVKLTTIVVFTPSNPEGPVTVVVTNPGGFSDGRANGFTYLLSLTPPAVNAGDDQSEEEGDEVTINAQFVDNLGDKPHTAEIDWGDGTVTPGVLVYSPFVFGIPITSGTVTGILAEGSFGGTHIG